jgi:uncharacterized spore protein YtfJ
VDVKDLMQRVGENLSVGRSFGSAYEKDGLLIIPVALVAGGGGGGGGPVTVDAEVDESASKTPSTDSSDEASGAGFGGVVLPVGAYVVKGEDVRWVPAVNVTLIALCALAVVRFAIRSRSKSQHRRLG